MENALASAHRSISFSDDMTEASHRLRIHVCLPSGCSTSLSASTTQRLFELKLAAQEIFGVKFLRLVADGRLLDLRHTVQEAQLCDGETLTAIQQLPQLARTAKAFALWCAGGGALAWGAPDFGGRPSRAVQELLQEGPAVQEIRATEAAFCALLADGRVVTWGDAAFGGDSREAQELAAGRVRQIGANSRAFVGILADGRAVTWGNPCCGGDSRSVHDRLTDVQQIAAASHAFAAVLMDGSVVSWGNADLGGDSSMVQDQLRHVQKLTASDCAFAALPRSTDALCASLHRVNIDSSF